MFSAMKKDICLHSQIELVLKNFTKTFSPVVFTASQHSGKSILLTYLFPKTSQNISLAHPLIREKAFSELQIFFRQAIRASGAR
jgi:hypothetical protein